MLKYFLTPARVSLAGNGIDKSEMMFPSRATRAPVFGSYLLSVVAIFKIDQYSSGTQQGRIVFLRYKCATQRLPGRITNAGYKIFRPILLISSGYKKTRCRTAGRV